jgi:hypothetical protein
LNDNGQNFKRLDYPVYGNGWSDLVSFGDMNNDGAIDLITRHEGIKVYVNDDIPDNYIELTVLGNGYKNQHGRIVIAKYSETKSKAMVIDSGSGYMSNQPYELIVPNDTNRPVGFTIYCANKIVTFSANSGEITKDCMN